MSKESKAKIVKRLRRGLVGVGLVLTRRARERLTPRVNTGTLRRAVGVVEKPGGVYWGVSATAAPHARYLEFGFRPHWVPFTSAPALRVWASRVGHPSVRGRGSRIREIARGVYIGGPASRLEHGPGGASGLYPGPGGIRPRRWVTRGGSSDLLGPGLVGWSFLRWTLKSTPKGELLAAFRRGYYGAV